MYYVSDPDNDNEVEEYLPETNGETLELLNLVGELQLTPREDDEDSNDILLEQMSARTNDTAGKQMKIENLVPGIRKGSSLTQNFSCRFSSLENKSVKASRIENLTENKFLGCFIFQNHHVASYHSAPTRL